MQKKAGEFNVSLRENEEQIIRKAIVECSYNISKASKVLGIARCTLYRKISKYNISAEHV
jgi:transcriptional regulator of acetoin/glycerol metabolism